MIRVGCSRLPTNWRDWRFGFVVREPVSCGWDAWIALGPLAFELWLRKWPK